MANRVGPVRGVANGRRGGQSRGAPRHGRSRHRLGRTVAPGRDRAARGSKRTQARDPRDMGSRRTPGSHHPRRSSALLGARQARGRRGDRPPRQPEQSSLNRESPRCRVPGPKGKNKRTPHQLRLPRDTRTGQSRQPGAGLANRRISRLARSSTVGRSARPSPRPAFSRGCESRGDHQDVSPADRQVVCSSQPMPADRRPATRRGRFPNWCKAATTRPWLKRREPAASSASVESCSTAAMGVLEGVGTLSLAASRHAAGRPSPGWERGHLLGEMAAGQFVRGSCSQISPPREIAASTFGLAWRSASSAATSRPIPSRFSGKRAGTHTKP